MSSDSTSGDVNEIVEPTIIVVPSKSFESPCAEYSFMIVPTHSYSTESSEFFSMIQHVISSAFSFTDHLGFIPESSLSLAEFDVCHSKHHIYLILSSLGVLLRMPTALHLPVVHNDNITRLKEIYNDTDKLVAYSYSILQKFAVDNKVVVTSHPEAVRKLHAWRADFDKILSASAYELNSP